MRMRKETISFFILAYALSWLIWLPLYGPQLGIEGLPVLPYHHALGGLGPALAAMWMSRKSSFKNGLSGLMKTSFFPYTILWPLLALLTPSLLLLIASFICGDVHGIQQWMDQAFTNKEYSEMTLPVFFAYNLIFFGWGEEIGWRGFVLPRFLSSMGLLKASILLTLFWALWHWPLFLYRPGYTTMGVGGTFGWILSLLTGSIIIAWLYSRSKQSVLVCAILHSTIDVAFTSEAATSEVTNTLGALITFWGIAVLFDKSAFHWKKVSG